MKLWHVAQWGNTEEGPDGHDTNCIVRAPDLAMAVKLAEEHFGYMWNAWKKGQADVAYLLGEDSNPNDGAKVIIYNWINPAFNMAHNPAWYRHHETNEWLDQKTMYGE